MIDRHTIFEIHRLADSGLSRRQIANQLRLARKTVGKYLDAPDLLPKPRKKQTSKLDPFRDKIATMIEECPDIRATVILQHLKEQGFAGSLSLLRGHLRELRGKKRRREPFIRFESAPGKQMQVDWGHFGSLPYENGSRKLYCLAVIEAHSRMLYVHFTHSQKQEALHQGLLAAFIYFGGSPKEVVVDNMLTAVTERVGSMIRFNERFLDFLRIFKITPVACNVRAPHEKGKVENSIKYIRTNFWPLRKFKDLADVQGQALTWLSDIANIRKHQTTSERPVDRLQPKALKSLPAAPDCRETMTLKVYKDFGVRFDCNVYTVPPWAIDKNITLKADNQQVFIFHKEKTIAVHSRSWAKKKRIELAQHREQVKKLRKKLGQDQQVRVFLSLGQPAADYLEKLADSGQSIKKNVASLLKLFDEYGLSSLLYGLQKAASKKLYGADYVENILYQEMTPTTCHPPVKLQKQNLNEIRLTTPSLADYDAMAIKRRKK